MASFSFSHFGYPALDESYALSTMTSGTAYQNLELPPARNPLSPPLAHHQSQINHTFTHGSKDESDSHSIETSIYQTEPISAIYCAPHTHDTMNKGTTLIHRRESP